MLTTNLKVPLDHLNRLTDCFGIIQHADHAVPDWETGYTTDDNARALVVAAKHFALYSEDHSRELATRYLAFLKFVQNSDGRFRNFLSHDRRFLDEVGSEDTFGRAFFALAYLLYQPPFSGLVAPAEKLVHNALPVIQTLEHPRAKALTIIGLYYWALARPADSARANELTRSLADYLVSRYREHNTPDWQWILPEMTYANAKLPEALFRAYQTTGEEHYLDVARRTFDFLCQKAIKNDTLSLVGNHGWFSSGEEHPPLYDQQPIDAAAMVDAALAAYDTTSDAAYLHTARISLEWFFGRNLRGESLYDPETQGCFDGLMHHGVNQNRGAESTICMLLTQLGVFEILRSLRTEQSSYSPQLSAEINAFGGPPSQTAE